MRYIFILIIFLIWSCNPDDCPYYMTIPGELQPLKREYKVGDTLSFNSTFSWRVAGYNIKDEATGKYDMRDYKWHPTNQIYRLDIPDPNSASVIYDNFEVFIDSIYDYRFYFLSGNESGLHGEYSILNDSFQLKYKLVPKNPGIFFFTHQSGIIGTSRQDFPGSCRRNSVDVYVDLNNGEYKNIDLLKEAVEDYWRNFRYDYYSNNKVLDGWYVFKVVP